MDRDKVEDDTARVSPDEAASAAAAPDDTQGSLLFSSTVTRGQYHQCGAGRRVKLYFLDGQAWIDRGTGYCAGVYDEDKDRALLVARREEFCDVLGDVAAQPGDSDEAYTLVIDESLGTDDALLLCSPVVKDDVYQRQQDTLVVWTEPDGTDLALSFQEPEGCSEVWDFLTEVQLHFMLDKNDDRAHALRMASSDDDGFMAPFALPPPTLENVEEAAAALQHVSAHATLRRDKAVEWLLSHDYVRQLIPLFDDAEQRELLPTLHHLYTIMKSILTMNDNVLVESILEDDVFYGVMGMLEYNPAYAELKASHRDYLQNHTHFHAVVSFDDSGMEARIVDTYRLQYLRDVVLAGYLEDATTSMLTSLLYFHQTDIVNACVSNPACLDELKAIVDGVEVPGRKHEAVLFLHQLCTIAKHTPLPGRVSLFRRVIERGLLRVVAYALAQPAPLLRNAGAEILAAAMEYDANSVRASILAQAERDEPTLFRLLVDLLLATRHVGFQGQLAEAVRTLLDASVEGIANSPMAQGTVAKAEQDPELFLTWLYKGEIDRMFRPVLRLPALGHPEADRPMRLTQQQLGLYTHLSELLCYIIAHHSFRSQYYVLTSEVVKHMGTLLSARDKTMRLAALHVFRACLSSSNQFMHRHLVSMDAVHALLDVLERELPRDNLVSSTCLGFFEQLRRDNVRVLLEHLATEHAEQLARLASEPTLRASLQGLVPDAHAVPPADTSAPAPESDSDEYFASEDTVPLVPYADDDADDALFTASVRCVRTDDEDDEDVLGRLPKRTLPTPSTSAIDAKRRLVLSHDAFVRASEASQQ